MSNGTSAGPTRSLRFGSELLGEPQAWTVINCGLEYRGEVVVAETVNPEWGQPLRDDLSFRLVFYTVPRRIPAGQIVDPRVAMAVPRRPADPAREALIREISSIHEAKERYVTSREAETLALRETMEEREASLSAELARRNALSYGQGRIYTQSGMSIRPSDVFIGDDPGSWADNLAVAVLEKAFPTLPLGHGEFPHPLDAMTVEDVFRGIFQGDPAAAEEAASFAPALGLATREAPTVFDDAGCRVLEIIQRAVEAGGGEMPAGDAASLLRHTHGLSRSLAVLYLLAFVHHAGAELELVNGHSVQLRHGGLFIGDRITWDTVQEVSFSDSIDGDFRALRVRPPLVWNTVLPYASLLAEGFEASQEESSITEQEHKLLDALDDLASRIERSRQEVSTLAVGLEADAGTSVATLDSLSVLCTATGYRGFHALAQSAFGSRSGFSQALDLHSRLEQLVALAPAITRTRLYLDEMTFRAADRDLALERDTVVGRPGLDSLIANPSLWSSVYDAFHQLRRRYAAVYRARHARYHEEGVELRYRLERLRPPAEAIARFNDVPEFGGPLATEVPARLIELMASIRTCELRADEIALEPAPSCHSCELPMDEEIPRRQAALLFTDTEVAMREYNRRLSSEGVRRILAHPNRGQLDKFINLVQVSDLSALANVLDGEVVEFLRSFVKRG